jgi:hypothetical protein
MRARHQPSLRIEDLGVEAEHEQTSASADSGMRTHGDERAMAHENPVETVESPAQVTLTRRDPRERPAVSQFCGAW